MALADPQSIKISGTTTSLPRTSTGENKSEYTSADGTLDMLLSTQKGKRLRQVVRVDQSKITEDPFISTQNVEVGSSITLVIDRPRDRVGFNNTDTAALVAGFIEALTKEESKIITKLLAGES
jgi:hypothetical protein